ncbi:thymidylate synthase [Pseudomonas aeruginosa]|uniref:thymidylate synthase n=1 Tax=Pseudomonas aeruginosa TaxID=287 RepID=UPI003D29195F
MKQYLDLQLTRTVRRAPFMELDASCTELDDFSFESFTLHDYAPHPAIKMPVAV